MTTTPADSRRVSLNIDVYGTYARESALADYLEVAALFNVRVTEAALARSIEESGWAILPRRQFLTPDNYDEDPGAWAESVFSAIRDRAQLLGDQYPFEIERAAVRARISGSNVLTSPYLALLAITVLHAWNIAAEGGPDPADILEAVVARTLGNRGLQVCPMGAGDRAGRSFAEVVADGGRVLGVTPMADPLPRHTRVKDAGIDTLAGLMWADGRRGGQWIFIGQATVGQSNTWKLKLNEPEAAIWAEYMQEPLFPQPFLAIPHHAHDDHLEMLTAAKRGLVLDRLRLCPFMGDNSSEERELITQLLSVVVE